MANADFSREQNQTPGGFDSGSYREATLYMDSSFELTLSSALNFTDTPATFPPPSHYVLLTKKLSLLQGVSPSTCSEAI